MDDEQLEAKLYPGPSSPTSKKQMPDWAKIHAELRKKSVTLQLLWMEHKSNSSDGHQYTQFCHHYRQWKKTVDLPFRNEHRAGEKTFVDYAGQTMPVYDPRNGGVRHAQIFIGVLGASNYTFAEATWTQSLPDWIDSHNRMYVFFGGVTEITTPDNLKAGVTKACRYDPLINPTYYAMAKHYGTAIIPARARKPKDKAKAEQGVLLVERWILAALRNRQFFSLDELNKAIAELLDKLNRRPFQKLAGCRLSAFEEIDKPALNPLPSKEFEICEFKTGKVNINYHFEVDKHYYSVPYEHVQKEVEARYTTRTVEILLKGNRIASHKRSFKIGGYTTTPGHMPPSHQEHVKWTPNRMINWVGQAGPSTAKLAKMVLGSRKHPQQSFRTILGMIRLGKKYGNDKLEQASFRALRLETPNYRSLKSILELGLENAPIKDDPTDETPIDHQNIRGPDYYC
jgi:transposase